MGSFLETEIDPFKGRRMVFASTAIFLRARAEIKKFALRAASSLESTTREQRALFI